MFSTNVWSLNPICELPHVALGILLVVSAMYVARTRAGETCASLKLGDRWPGSAVTISADGRNQRGPGRMRRTWRKKRAAVKLSREAAARTSGADAHTPREIVLTVDTIIG